MYLRYILAFLLLMPAFALAKVKVVTSTSDLAWLTQRIGGEQVEVEAIASPKADIHYVEVRPSFMRKVAKANLVFKVGLELDMWMDQIIDGSRNGDLTVVDCSRYIEPLEVPTFKADARYGDLHRFGNPHYWLGPDNVEPITMAIVEGLAQVDPESADLFRSRREEYLVELNGGLEGVRQSLPELQCKEVIFYHNSWPYFNSFTGLSAAGFIEPYPGVPPSPSHIKEVIDLIKSRDIKVIVIEPYFDRRVPDKIAADTGAKVVILYPSVGGRNEGENYLDWLRGNIQALIEACR